MDHMLESELISWSIDMLICFYAGQVRPYPRRAFSDLDSGLSLNDLGLSSKQEALFLELI